jgi:hypothetical protein
MVNKIYVSDPEYSRSFVGRWLWIYRSKGILELGDDQILITCGKIKLVIARSDIRGLSLGTFSRIAKPIPLHYIRLDYEEDPYIRSVYVVPWIPGRSPWLIPVWTTNKNTGDFLDLLKRWQREAEKESM